MPRGQTAPASPDGVGEPISGACGLPILLGVCAVPSALLIGEGRVDDAIEVLRPHAGRGGQLAAYQLAELLAQRGHTDEVISVMRPYTGGEWQGDDPLAAMLIKHGHIETEEEEEVAYG